jgi:hypothetical protein
MDKLERKLRRDEAYQTYLRIIASMDESKLNGYIKEVKKLHAGRTSRMITSKVPEHKLIDASGIDQSYRSRATEILMEVNPLYARLEKTLDSIQGHLMTEYAQYLDYTTKGEREMAAMRFLDEGHKLLVKMDAVDTVCRLMIEDIDKAAFVLKHAIEIKVLVSKPERTL